MIESRRRRPNRTRPPKRDAEAQREAHSQDLAKTDEAARLFATGPKEAATTTSRPRRAAKSSLARFLWPTPMKPKP